MITATENLPITLWHTTINPTVWLVVIRREKHFEPEVYVNALLAYARVKELGEQNVKADWIEVPVRSELQKEEQAAK